jgi:hypothetical protein
MELIAEVGGLPVCPATAQVAYGCFAVDLMRDGLMVEAAPQLSEIERFGYLGPDA